MNKAYHIICLLAVCVLLFLFGYRAGRQRALPSPVAVADTVYLSDTVWATSPAIVKEIPVPVPTEVDTAAILADHFIQRVYNDTLVNDVRLSLAVRDTVFQNRLLGRAIAYTVKVPIAKRAFSVGLTTGYRNISLMAGYRNRRTEYQVGYDVYNRAAMFALKYDIAQW